MPEWHGFPNDAWRALYIRREIVQVSSRYSQTQSVMCHAVAHRRGMAKVGRRLLRQPGQPNPDANDHAH
jgi:hypothetical protein